MKRGNHEDVDWVNEVLINEPEATKRALCIELNDTHDKHHYGFEKGKIVKEIPKFPVLPFNPE
ncbi:MAG: hypothetical protein WDO19_30810 [Bacteroidota bacterium]